MAKLWSVWEPPPPQTKQNITAGLWMAAICHTYRMLDGTELDKWKWTSRHMRSRAERKAAALTQTQGLKSVLDSAAGCSLVMFTIYITRRQFTTYLHFDKGVCQAMTGVERSLFTAERESFITGFNSSLLKVMKFLWTVSRRCQSGRFL